MRTRFADLEVGRFRLPHGFEQEFLTPALVVHLEHVRANLDWMLRAMGGDPARWRPHVKTTKIPAIFAEVLRAGVRHFKAATTREVQELLLTVEGEGVEHVDVCLAYPLRSLALARLGDLARRFSAHALSVLVEDEVALQQVPRELGVFLDLNPGMNRTGIPLDDGARLARLAERAGGRLRGLHFYDGHLHEGDHAERQVRAFEGYDRLLEVVGELSLGERPLELTTSGTPAFLHALAYPGFRAPDTEGAGPVHRVSPGTVVYHDLRSEQENERLELTPAALVVAQFVSHPAPGIATCNAGSKSLAAEAGDPAAFVLGRANWIARTPSEEHLPIDVSGGPLPERGELLQLVPRHVCPTINLAEEAVLLQGGEVHSVVNVSARAHELRATAR